MTDVNLNNQGLATRNFENYRFNLNEEQVNNLKELLNKDGVFTLGDNDEITVVSPHKPKSVIVRALKWVFSSDYHAENRARARYEQLKNNIHFNKMLVKLYKNVAYDNTVQGNRIFKAKLQDYVTSLNAAGQNNANNVRGVTTSALKNIMQNSNNSMAELESISSNLFNDKTSGNAVSFKGMSLSLNEFFNTYLPEHRAKNISARALANSVLSHLIMAKGDDIKFLNRNYDLECIREYLGKRNHSDAEKSEFKKNLAVVLNDVNKLVSKYIKDKLEKGFTPESIADKLAGGIADLNKHYNGYKAAEHINKFFGANGVLGNEDGLDQKFNVEGNVRKPVNFSIPDINSPRYENYKKLSDNLKNYDSHKIAQILEFTKNDSDKVDLYIRMAMCRGADDMQSVPGEIEGLLTNITDKRLDLVLEVSDEIDQLLKDNLGNNASDEQKAEFIEFWAHHYTLYKTSFARFDYEKIQSAYSDLVKLDSELSKSHPKTEAERQRIQKSLHQIKTLTAVLDKVLTIVQKSETGSTQKTSSAENAAASVIYRTFTDKLAIEKINLKEKIGSVLGRKTFSATCKANAVKMIEGLIHTHVNSHGLVLNNETVSVDNLIRHFSRLIRNDNHIMQMLDSSKFTAEHFLKVDGILSGDNGFKAHFLGSMNQLKSFPLLDENGEAVLDEKGEPKTYKYAETLDLDLPRGSIISINNLQPKTINDPVAQKEQFHQEFNRSVPPQFRGFTSNFLQQGGVGNLFLMKTSVEDPNESFIPGLSTTQMLFDPDTKSVSYYPHHEITREGNRLVIKSNLTLRCELGGNLKTDKIPLHEVELVTTIDLNAGVDENGVPLGITYKTAYKGVSE